MSAVAGTLAELDCEVDRDGAIRFYVTYWLGGLDSVDETKVRREFDTLRKATGFLAMVASNKSRSWREHTIKTWVPR